MGDSYKPWHTWGDLPPATESETRRLKELKKAKERQEMKKLQEAEKTSEPVAKEAPIKSPNQCQELVCHKEEVESFAATSSALCNSFVRLHAVASNLESLKVDIDPTFLSHVLSGAAASQEGPVISIPVGVPPTKKIWLAKALEGKHNIVINDPSAEHFVYIFGCRGCYLCIKGEVHSIIMKESTTIGLRIEDVSSSFVVMRCVDVDVQMTGKVTNVTIADTDECTIYLIEEAKGSNIVTTGCREVHILAPDQEGFFQHTRPAEDDMSVWIGSCATVVKNAK